MRGEEKLKKSIVKKKSLGVQRLFLAAFFVFLFFIGGLMILAQLPAEVIARGVSIGPFAVGGLTQEQAASFLQKQTAAFEERGLDFINGDRRVNLAANVSALGGPELAYTIFRYDPETSAKRAIELGRQGSPRQKFFDRLYLRVSGKRLSLDFNLDEERAVKFLKDNLSFFENQPQNAALKIVFADGGAVPFQIQINPEETGRVFDYLQLTQTLKTRLAEFDSSAISIALQVVEPEIKIKDIEKMKPTVEKILTKGELPLNYESQNFTVPVARWAGWLSVKRENGQVVLDLDESIVAADLMALVPDLQKETEEAKFAMKDGRVIEFSPGVVGVSLDIEKTKESIGQVLFDNADKAVIAVKKTEPLTQVAALNELGIKEIIGVGKSNFKGSPPNRIHNIKTGAASLNGILIAPGEVFSLLKALGKIDGEHGYKPELVIKGNKTVPEFGGGLCQIGTTTFRAALSSGLPIVERQNHSYRVPYYEPPVGVDATIYDPKPDFRFLNDTGRYILIQTRIDGSELIFEFWGTKDGRAAVQSEPIVYNVTSPPPPKLIETLDLPVGRKKCTEKAHAGADAVFTYTVTYSDGTVKKQEFKSHYRPWREVCLIGVEKLSEPPLSEGEGVASGENAVTSTPSAAP